MRPTTLLILFIHLASCQNNSTSALTSPVQGANSSIPPGGTAVAQNATQTIKSPLIPSANTSGNQVNNASAGMVPPTAHVASLPQQPVVQSTNQGSPRHQPSQPSANRNENHVGVLPSPAQTGTEKAMVISPKGNTSPPASNASPSPAAQTNQGENENQSQEPSQSSPQLSTIAIMGIVASVVVVVLGTIGGLIFVRSRHLRKEFENAEPPFSPKMDHDVPVLYPSDIKRGSGPTFARASLYSLPSVAPLKPIRQSTDMCGTERKSVTPLSPVHSRPAFNSRIFPATVTHTDTIASAAKEATLHYAYQNETASQAKANRFSDYSVSTITTSFYPPTLRDRRDLISATPTSAHPLFGIGEISSPDGQLPSGQEVLPHAPVSSFPSPPNQFTHIAI